jgi:hypothetical protein
MIKIGTFGDEVCKLKGFEGNNERVLNKELR